ncbi:MAG: helix-turn-helix transcriptional regulator [Acholeplasmatales bacterium]|nr:helix-turn-helix transcriptional regulator [Acholeplasmatales bacterium]
MTLERHVGIKVRKRRLELKLTQVELCDITHISRQYLYEIETGKKSMTIGTLQKLRKALRVSYNYFFSGSDANS